MYLASSFGGTQDRFILSRTCEGGVSCLVSLRTADFGTKMVRWRTGTLGGASSSWLSCSCMLGDRLHEQRRKFGWMARACTPCGASTSERVILLDLPTGSVCLVGVMPVGDLPGCSTSPLRTSPRICSRFWLDAVGCVKGDCPLVLRTTSLVCDRRGRSS
jgi:hypothetical protein